MRIGAEPTVACLSIVTASEFYPFLTLPSQALSAFGRIGGGGGYQPPFPHGSELFFFGFGWSPSLIREIYTCHVVILACHKHGGHGERERERDILHSRRGSPATDALLSFQRRLGNLPILNTFREILPSFPFGQGWERGGGTGASDMGGVLEVIFSFLLLPLLWPRSHPKK